MLRSIVFGSASAMFFGMTSAILGSLAFGVGSLAFLVGSSLGFVLGTFRWYRHSLLQSLLVLDAYPALMRLHLHANFPLKRFNHLPLRDCRSDRFRGRWIMENMLVVAWLTAGPALDVSWERVPSSRKSLILEQEMRINEERVLIETAAASEPLDTAFDGAKAP